MGCKIASQVESYHHFKIIIIVTLIRFFNERVVSDRFSINGSGNFSFYLTLGTREKIVSTSIIGLIPNNLFMEILLKFLLNSFSFVFLVIVLTSDRVITYIIGVVNVVFNRNHYGLRDLWKYKKKALTEKSITQEPVGILKIYLGFE